MHYLVEENKHGIQLLKNLLYIYEVVLHNILNIYTISIECSNHMICDSNIIFYFKLSVTDIILSNYDLCYILI